MELYFLTCFLWLWEIWNFLQQKQKKHAVWADKLWITSHLLLQDIKTTLPGLKGICRSSSEWETCRSCVPSLQDAILKHKNTWLHCLLSRMHCEFYQTSRIWRHGTSLETDGYGGGRRWRSATGTKCSFKVNLKVLFCPGIASEDGWLAFAL